MEDLELQKLILLRIQDISDKLHFLDLEKHELKKTYRTIDISGLGYLKERFLSYLDLLNIKRYEESLFHPDYKLAETGEKSSSEQTRFLSMVLKNRLDRNTENIIALREQWLSQFKPIKLRIWSIILHSILKIFSIISELLSDSLPNMLSIKTSGSQRTINILQAVSKTGRAVTSEELLWLSRDAMYKNASNISNIRESINTKTNIGVPTFVNWGDRASFKATKDSGETAYIIQSRLSPFPIKK